MDEGSKRIKMNGISKETFERADHETKQLIMFDLQYGTWEKINEICPTVDQNKANISALYRIVFYLLGASGIGGFLVYLGK